MLSSMRCVVHLSTRTLMPFAGIRRGADEENMLRCRGALRCMSQLIPPIIREFTVGFSEACRHTMHAAERVLCRFNQAADARKNSRASLHVTYVFNGAAKMVQSLASADDALLCNAPILRPMSDTDRRTFIGFAIQSHALRGRRVSERLNLYGRLSAKARQGVTWTRSR